MGIPERKEKQKQEIKKMILDASMKLFVEEGFSNVTIRRIADIIEYSPTTVYLYFKDKNDILYNLHDLGFQLMMEKNRSLAEIENPLMRLYKMGENYIEFGLQNPEFYDIMFIQIAPMQVLDQQKTCDWKPGEQALDALKATVEECMERGILKKGNVEAASMAIWGMVHGLVSLSIRNRLEKLHPPQESGGTNETPQDFMRQAMTWFLNSVDQSGKK